MKHVPETSPWTYADGYLADVDSADVDMTADGNLWIVVGDLRCNVHRPLTNRCDGRYGIRWIERADGFPATGADVADVLR